MKQVYRFAWKSSRKWHKWPAWYNRECIALRWLRLNSVWIRFLDTGQEEVTDRRALRKVTHLADAGKPIGNMFEGEGQKAWLAK
jgi:hypothetical protein